MKYFLAILLVVGLSAGCGPEGDSGGSISGVTTPGNGCLNAASPPSATAAMTGTMAQGGARLVATPRPDVSAVDVRRALDIAAPVVRPRPSSRFVLEDVRPGARESLEATGLFERIEVDRRASASSVPNDPHFGNQWHLARIEAAAAWDITHGSSSVTVAVIDSGVHQHPDLTPNIVQGWNFLSDSPDTTDVLGHGTAVAGCVAAAMNNAYGGSGVAPNVRIMPLVVLSAQNQAWYSDIAEAIRYAADHGARIVNISIGGPGTTSDLNSAVQYAWQHGTVVFASAMNSGDTQPQFPAACANAIAVSASTPDDQRASFSCWGEWIDLAAPGVSMLTTTGANGMAVWNGTSFASPTAAGVAALALSVHPDLSASALVTLLRQTTDDLGSAGFDPSFGWGLVNAQRAVSAASENAEQDATAPIVYITDPTCDLFVQGLVTVQGNAHDVVGIERVEFSVDGAYQAEVTQAHFTFLWNAIPGTHTLTVTAYDTAGNSRVAWTRVTMH